MPSEARRLHGFTVVSRALRIARQLALPAIIGGASAAGGFSGALGWIAAILAVPSLLVAVAQWLAFRYRLEADELVIDSGVLSRRRRVIPLGRVQNIDVEQGALERLFGVAELRLETASGGTETEAKLAVLGHEEARALQAELMRRRHVAGRGTGAAGAAPAAPADRQILRLGIGQLVVAGATSNEAGLIAAGLATFTGFMADFVAAGWIEELVEEAVRTGAAAGAYVAALGIVALVLGVVIAGWVVSIGASIVRFFGFVLTRAGDDLRREYGLLSRHRSTVPLERVQAIRIEQTLLRRPFGLVALKIETAGAGPQQQTRGRPEAAEAFVPIARRDDVPRLLAEVFPDARFQGTAMRGVAPVSRRRSFLRLAAPLVLLAAGLRVLYGPIGLWTLLLLLPAWAFAHAQYRARGWARPEGYTLARAGVVTRITWIIPERKIQTLHLRETPFQRRWHLATLMVDTAAGGRLARVVDLDRETGSALLADLARDAETARRKALRPAATPAAGQGGSPQDGSLSFRHG